MNGAFCPGNAYMGTSGHGQNGLIVHARARARTCPCPPVPSSSAGHLTPARARSAVLFLMLFQQIFYKNKYVK